MLYLFIILVAFVLIGFCVVKAINTCSIPYIDRELFQYINRSTPTTRKHREVRSAEKLIHKVSSDSFQFDSQGVEYKYISYSDTCILEYKVKDHSVKIVVSGFLLRTYNVNVNDKKCDAKHANKIIQSIEHLAPILLDFKKQLQDAEYASNNKEKIDHQQAIEQVTFDSIQKTTNKEQLAEFMVSPDPAEREFAKARAKQLEKK